MKNIYRDGTRSPELALKPFLHEGETVLWTGTPYENSSFRLPLLPIVFVSVWLCAVLAFIAASARIGGPFALMGVPFLLFGIGLLCALVLVPARIGKTVLYAVTDTRALVLHDTSAGTECAEFVFSRLSGATLRRNRDGSGTVILLPLSGIYSGGGTYRAGRYRRIANGTFECIADADRVYRLVSERISGSPSGRSGSV